MSVVNDPADAHPARRPTPGTGRGLSPRALSLRSPHLCIQLGEAVRVRFTLVSTISVFASVWARRLLRRSTWNARRDPRGEAWRMQRPARRRTYRPPATTSAAGSTRTRTSSDHDPDPDPAPQLGSKGAGSGLGSGLYDYHEARQVALRESIVAPAAGGFARVSPAFVGMGVLCGSGIASSLVVPGATAPLVSFTRPVLVFSGRGIHDSLVLLRRDSQRICCMRPAAPHARSAVRTGTSKRSPSARQSRSASDSPRPDCQLLAAASASSTVTGSMTRP